MNNENALMVPDELIMNKILNIRGMKVMIELSMFRIQEYISDMDFISFKKDNKTVDAVVQNFEINDFVETF